MSNLSTATIFNRPRNKYKNEGVFEELQFRFRRYLANRAVLMDDAYLHPVSFRGIWLEEYLYIDKDRHTAYVFLPERRIGSSDYFISHTINIEGAEEAYQKILNFFARAHTLPAIDLQGVGIMFKLVDFNENMSLQYAYADRSIIQINGKTSHVKVIEDIENANLIENVLYEGITIKQIFNHPEKSATDGIILSMEYRSSTLNMEPDDNIDKTFKIDFKRRSTVYQSNEKTTTPYSVNLISQDSTESSSTGYIYSQNEDYWNYYHKWVYDYLNRVKQRYDDVTLYNHIAGMIDNHIPFSDWFQDKSN